MQAVSRQVGRLLNKGPGDNAKVSVLLNDYEDADKALSKIVESAEAWRSSWLSLLDSQLGILNEYEGLYDPVVGAPDTLGRSSAPTGELQLMRTFKLREAYAELKTELVDEVALVESKVIRPATECREYIGPWRKIIKGRENKRLDYERSQDKVSKLQRKPGKTAKDQAALAKAEQEMSSYADDFHVADSHLRETLPPIVATCFSILPPLLASVVHIQNQLLALYYTTVHDYCQEQGFPSPPPPMEEVISEWSSSFRPIQTEIESFSCVAHGRAIRQATNSTGTSAAEKTGFRRSSSSLIPSTHGDSRPGPPSARVMRIPSAPVISPVNQKPSPQPNPSSKHMVSKHNQASELLKPTDFTTASELARSPSASPSMLRTRADYFNSQNLSSHVNSMPSNAAIISKKKPPPPPPPKRNVPSEEFVVALYAFTAQGAGDLSFNEGDRIKVVKKTETEQDWWVGELGGLRGNFPANYCKAT